MECMSTSVRIEKTAKRINESYSDYSLLDVGCRTRDIVPHLKSCKQYNGTDIMPYEGVLQCDLSQKLPFTDGEFDIVIALDVLEHLDKPQEALQELLRITNKALYISLPNMYYIDFRWKFLRGHGLGGKYIFHPHAVIDRHRWILSCHEAIEFIGANVGDLQWEHEVLLPHRGRTKKVADPVQAFLASTWPNLFGYGVLFEIKK